MSLVFSDAVPVATAGPGRNSSPNPYTDIIAAIALKTQDVDGKTVPVAKLFPFSHDADPGKRKKEIERIKRQLSAAGHANTPDVSVMTHVAPVKVGAKGKETDSLTDSVMTFWTIPPIVRPRKPKPDEAVTTEAVTPE